THETIYGEMDGCGLGPVSNSNSTLQALNTIPTPVGDVNNAVWDTIAFGSLSPDFRNNWPAYCITSARQKSVWVRPEDQKEFEISDHAITVEAFTSNGDPYVKVTNDGVSGCFSVNGTTEVIQVFLCPR